MQKLFLLGLMCCSIGASAQRLMMEWDRNPEPHTITRTDFIKESAVMISEKNQLEVGKNLSGNIVYIRRTHKIIKVLDEKGIESYNKIKIGYSENNPITLIKARTISPTGKIVELKPEAFKDTKEEDGNMVKLFALENVEKGSEIEYIVYKRQPFRPFGTEYLQDVIPTLESWFEFISNENLLFDIKGYHGVTRERDSLMNGKNCYLAYIKDLPGLEEEKYASYLPHFARVEYSLAYNIQENGKDKRLFTWDDIAKNVYKTYTTFSSKEIKEGKKILDNKTYQSLSGTLQKVNWIENYIKGNIVQQEYVQAENAEDIEFIIKNKLTTEDGIKKMFALLLFVDNIDFEIGYTTNRFNKPFDYSFINPDNLADCLFYIPAIQQYIAPNYIVYRSPYIPAVFRNNHALFAKVVRLRNIATASAEDRLIPEMGAADNFHNHDVNVSFTPDLDTSVIQISNTFHGQNMIEVLPAFIYLDKEKKEEAAKDIIRVSEKDEKIDGFAFENNEFTALQNSEKSLKVSAVIHATNNIEKAGAKYLFKVGELIGRQAEMYQERERMFDLEIPNPHQYTRKIHINIPSGFTVKNIDKLAMQVIANDGNKESCKFVSTYTQNGQSLDIEVFEIYHQSFTPKSAYEAYRKVINAAADFNKIVLVFEKL